MTRDPSAPAASEAAATASASRASRAAGQRTHRVVQKSVRAAGGAGSRGGEGPKSERLVKGVTEGETGQGKVYTRQSDQGGKRDKGIHGTTARCKREIHKARDKEKKKTRDDKETWRQKRGKMKDEKTTARGKRKNNREGSS